MAESACILRSFSQSTEISSRGANEGDPLRALTESISFGRFMSESLAWEKWSTFSHNRYLEEIENLSKPGSVAQKKAFFEAHYNKRAAKKAAVRKVLEEADVTGNLIPECETQKDAHVNSEVPMVVMNTDKAIDEERQQVEVSNTEVDCVVGMNSDSSTSKMDETTIVKNCEVIDLNLENSNSMEEIEQFDNGKNHFEMAKVQNEGNSASQGKERRLCSSLGSKGCSRNPRPTSSRGGRLDSSFTETGNLTASCDDKSTGVSKTQKRSVPESLRVSTGSASSFSGISNKRLIHMPQDSPRSSTCSKVVGESDKKKGMVSSSVHMLIPVAPARQLGKGSQKTLIGSTDGKAKGEADKKVRSVPSSIHKPMNFASSACQSDKTSPKKRTRSSHACPTSKAIPRIARDDLISENCSARASVIGLFKRPLENNLPSEDKRKNTITCSSVSGKTLNNPVAQSSVNRGKTLSPSGSYARSSTVFSPFSFRSAERAEKRKEFFKTIEEKKKKDKEKEAVNKQLPPKSKVPLTSPNSPRPIRNQTQFSNNV